MNENSTYAEIAQFLHEQESKIKELTEQNETLISKGLEMARLTEEISDKVIALTAERDSLKKEVEILTREAEAKQHCMRGQDGRRC